MARQMAKGKWDDEARHPLIFIIIISAVSIHISVSSN